MTAFTANDYAARARHATAQARDAGLAGLLVAPGPDMSYFLGASPGHASERLTLLVLPVDGPASLVVPTLERGDLEESIRASDIAMVGWRDGVDPYEVAAALLDADARYAVTDATWAMHVLALQRALPNSAYAACSDVLPMLRAAKTPAEIAKLAAAGAADDAAYADALTLRYAGRREADVSADFAQLLRDHGHEQVDFTIVASGPNGANPHHEGGNRVIEVGDLIVLDFGGLVDGYGSDMTRTVHVGPDVDPDEREVFDVVRAAQQAGFDAVRPGATCQDVDRAARAVITDAGYGEYFIHRTGHGIGMTTHEPPYLVEGESAPIAAGMCFSVEPGIYLPGRFGVRIEDIVVAFPEGTPEAGVRLNNAPHELAIVE